MRLVLTAAALLFSGSLSLSAQQADAAKEPAQVSFQFERPGLEVPKFTLSVNEDGLGRYVAEQVLANARGSADDTPDGSPPAMQHIDRPILLSRKTVMQIFAAARDLNRFTDPCASKAKNIADTGRKTLHYSGDGGDGTCVYNYSQDKKVTLLTDTFEAIAATLDMGRKLEFNHRFDRLGLDALTTELAQEVDTGRAIEVGMIAPSLTSIVQDSEVMERVRSRAVKLLQQAQPAL